MFCPWEGSADPLNIAFFLLPKSEVRYLSPKVTMRKALEIMEQHRYTAVPLVDDEGKYVGTLNEGDLLWKIKNNTPFSLEDSEKILLEEIPQRMQNKPVSIYSNMQDLISLATVQNFVPVIDDRNFFIGIVRRSDIINYCTSFLINQEGN